ncbi:MAG: right-handed parallel beta-helix repeat-containing protein, partial [Anaerolineae bacterium]
MRTRDIALSLALALGTTLGLLTLLHSPGQDGEIPAAHAAPLHAPHTAPGETFCVSHGGAAPPGCDSAFTQIQAAVDAASGGELIKVAGGVYDDIQTRGAISQVVYITKSVTIRGGYTTTDNFADPPDPTAYFTTIDGQGIGRGMYITGPITVTLEGLRVTNGWSDDKGGGFFVANARVTISRCQIFSNSVGNEGAGLFLLDADHATILQSDIFSNTADSHAGGILLESSDHVHLTQNNIYRNRASFWNGGVCIKIGSHITLDENTIHGNVAANGAGVLVEHAEDIALSDNDIFDNWARGGGGLYVQNSSRITLERTRVYSNTATSGDGGGMYLNQCSPVTFTNTLLADNRIDAASGEGAGAHIARSSTRFIHTTIARNTGGGGEGLYLRGGSTAWLTNTILVGHTVGAFLDWSTLTATHTLWGAGAWDNVTDVVEFDDSLANTSADIHGDPVFADPGAADYHILPPSAAWNAALDTGLSDDIDRDTRPRYSGVDIGADEYAGSCLVRLNDGTIFGTVQAAVDASTQSTDVVKVRGRCNTVHGRDGLNQVVYLNKTLTLQGGWDADFTAQDPEAYPATLDARRQGRVIFITDGVTPTIEDLTLTGGNASHETPYPGFGLGGGICVADADPIIRSNVITNNVSYTGTEPGTGGGGIFIRGASATSVISGNAILSNTARAEGTGSGGGIYLFRSTARVAENQIRHNTACYGGGVTAYDSDGLTLQGNTIISNTAIEDEYGLATGGGLAMEFTGPFTMTNNVIAQNDVSVSGTQAFARGGGFYLYGSPSSPDPDDHAFGWLANNTIAENTSGTGDGLYLLGSTVTLLNNIVVSHTEG